MANESRVLDCFGPNLVIESNGPVGLGGAIAYQLYATTDKDRAKWQQALHASGLSTMEASHGLEIQTGNKNKKGDISFMAMAHNGDLCLNSNSGWIRIKGKNIVLDATNQLLLQGKEITLGNADGSTHQTEILGTKILLNAKQEVKVIGSKRITRDLGSIFLKSKIGNMVQLAGTAQAAFVGGDKKAITLRGELKKGMYGAPAPPGQQFGPMASDIRLKENIIKVGNSPSGINIYEWNYKGKPQKYRGVMAQELLKSHPEAVTLCPNGFLGVYYGKIDVKMEKV